MANDSGIPVIVSIYSNNNTFAMLALSFAISVICEKIENLAQEKSKLQKSSKISLKTSAILIRTGFLYLSLCFNESVRNSNS